MKISDKAMKRYIEKRKIFFGYCGSKGVCRICDRIRAYRKELRARSKAKAAK